MDRMASNRCARLNKISNHIPTRKIGGDFT